MNDIKDIKKAYEKTEEMGRKIWLAGLGAYGQSIDSVQSNCGKVNTETRSLFEKLVARGEELESSTLKTINETRDDAVKKTSSKIMEQKEKILEQKDKILGQKEKIISTAEKLQSMAKEGISLEKIKPENLTLESVTETINSRLDEIRNKVNDLIPAMATREDVKELSEKVEEIAATKPKPKTTRAPRAKKAAPKAKAKTAAPKSEE